MRIIPVTVLVLSGAWMSAVHAQQKFAYSYDQPPEVVGKYIQRHSFEVGDVPAHTTNLAEIVTQYLSDKAAPTFANVRAKESRTVLMSDFTQNSGFSTGYRVYSMENGDKIFFKTSLMLQTTSANGKATSISTQVDTLTGGTGRFKNIRGTLNGTNKTTVGSTTTGSHVEGEYYFID